MHEDYFSMQFYWKECIVPHAHTQVNSIAIAIYYVYVTVIRILAIHSYMHAIACNYVYESSNYIRISLCM